MTDTTAKNTLALWDSVSEVDPLFTRQFTRGSFVGTSINPTYLAKQATEKFGPMGQGWGLNIVEEKYIDGHPIWTPKEGAPVLAKIHSLRVELWYVLDGQKGSVTQFGNTTFVGMGHEGMFTDEDAPKKSLTDAMGKCLSLLGFGADIYTGIFDDKNSVSDDAKAKAKAKAKVADSPKQEGATAEHEVSPELRQTLDAIARASLDRIVKAKVSFNARFPDKNDQRLLDEAIKKREQELTPA